MKTQKRKAQESSSATGGSRELHRASLVNGGREGLSVATPECSPNEDIAEVCRKNPTMAKLTRQFGWVPAGFRLIRIRPRPPVLLTSDDKKELRRIVGELT